MEFLFYAFLLLLAPGTLVPVTMFWVRKCFVNALSEEMLEWLCVGIFAVLILFTLLCIWQYVHCFRAAPVSPSSKKRFRLLVILSVLIALCLPSVCLYAFAIIGGMVSMGLTLPDAASFYIRLINEVHGAGLIMVVCGIGFYICAGILYALLHRYRKLEHGQGGQQE